MSAAILTRLRLLALVESLQLHFSRWLVSDGRDFARCRIANLCVTLLILLAPVTAVVGQSSTSETELSLASMAAFNRPADNWQIVRSVRSTRTVEGNLDTWPGIGVLANVAEGGDDLSTSFEHGDVQVDLEVLVPNGTATGLLFQGRYELTIADSWGKTDLDPNQFGGVAGVAAPTVNVSRAPGLWQRLSVLFRAPRFDATGQKIADAAFVRVVLNGVTVQEELALESPTSRTGQMENTAVDEVAAGPLVFRGDGGPVAYRNVKYRLLNNGPVTIEGLNYDYYRGDFGWELPELGTLTRKSGGPLDEITSAIADTVNRFAINFTGDLILPATGVYDFEITYTGQFALVIDGETVVDITSPEVAAVGDVPRKAASKRLTAGRHSFELLYARGRWHVALNAFGLYVSGPGSIRTRLSADGSDPNDVWAAFKVEPGEKARLQRSFVMHPSGEKVHAISVGYPNGNHYSYDSENGGLLHVWRGRFIDTSTMWFSRGNDQLAAPQGSLIQFSGRPTVAMELAGRAEALAANPAAPQAAPPGFRFGNYRLDDAGSPTFTYTVGDAEVVDAIKPDEDGRFFTRTLTVKNNGDGPIPLRLADAEWMSEVSEGVFVVGDGAYQIEIVEGSASIIEADGVMQLVAMMEPGAATKTVKTNLIW